MTTLRTQHGRSRPRVLVFGAGVAGLTAAHELAERGFIVVVVEPEFDTRSHTHNRRESIKVGGIAATQWCYLPKPRPQKDGPLETAEGNYNDAQRLPFLDPYIRFEPQSADLNKDATDRLKAISSHLAWRYTKAEAGKWEEPSLVGFWSSAECEALGLARANAVRDWLANHGVPANHSVAASSPIEDDRTERADAGFVNVIVPDQVLPGEHGYRFFPSFYFHLFDSMDRTPVPSFDRTNDLDFRTTQAIRREMGGKYPGISTATEQIAGRRVRASSRTVRDNLVSMTEHIVATAGPQRERPLRRDAITSLSDFVDLYTTLIGDLGFNRSDLVRFQGKLQGFLMSGERRRREIEGQSWADFLDLATFSPRFQEAMDVWPQALAGLRSSEGDARTHGEVSLQLVFDQFRQGFVDGSLNGPTSEVWLDHWKTYLERVADVQFLPGDLESIRVDDTNVVVGYREYRRTLEDALRGARPNGFDKKSQGDEYVVIATPLRTIARALAAGSTQPDDCPEGSDLRALATLAQAAAADDKSAYRDYVGIQFYLLQDVRWIRGHVYAADSPWRISLVSQAGHRVERMGSSSPVRGIISAIIGTLDAPGLDGCPGRKFKSKNMFAAEVWRQIQVSLRDLGGLPDEPYAFHIDDALHFSENGLTNKTPYFTNAARHPLPGRLDRDRGYELTLDRLTFCGTHMNTFTRLHSMEAANESARHAVNGILSQYAKDNDVTLGTPCAVRSMTDREPKDIRYVRALDDELHRRGLPPLTEVAGLDRAANWISRFLDSTKTR